MIDLANAVAMALGAPPSPAATAAVGAGIELDLTITMGNLLTLAGMIGMVALYVIDTRYSASGARGDMRRIAKTVDQLASDLKAHADEDAARFEQVRRETGEVVSAIRTKLTEVEIYARDTFVRRDSFAAALSQQQTLLTTMIADLKGWMGRIERRLDRAAGNGESG